MVRFSRREGLFLMLGASQAALLGTASAAVRTYDELVEFFFGASVVSYWKFENDGTDERGKRVATFSGTPELNVETIVEFDTNGECIAWSGTLGVHAEAAHHDDHKTPAGAIVVTFQHDTLAQKSILVAADRAAGGVAGPGGLSLEVETDGQPRCFLRRQSDGQPEILVGQTGDVQLNRAYTLIFQWGPAGLSMALYDDHGAPVRREDQCSGRRRHGQLANSLRCLS